MHRTRVLVVDAEPNARLALRELLEEEGYEVATSEATTDAMAKAEKFRPHVALIDVNKPEEGMHQSLAALGCIVILMSVRPWGRADKLAYLRKPLSIGELFGTVATAVQLALRALVLP
jgi:DNA-binding response OmpR family regulator